MSDGRGEMVRQTTINSQRGTDCFEGPLNGWDLNRTQNRRVFTLNHRAKKRLLQSHGALEEDTKPPIEPLHNKEQGEATASTVSICVGD